METVIRFIMFVIKAKLYKAKFLKVIMKLGRKASGGKYKAIRKKRSNEIKGQARVVKLGDKKTKKLRTKGGRKKIVSLNQKEINVFDGKKTKKVEITNVLETPSNRFLARQNILVKGAIVETSLGRVKITNRPSQEGNAQGILLKEDK